MAYRFLRENSQILAAFLSSGYGGLYVFYKAQGGSLLRENLYELKNKKSIYEDLSIQEEQEARKVVAAFFFLIFIVKSQCKVSMGSSVLEKFLYRLDGGSDKRFQFFRSNTLDFVSFGFNSIKQGCDIGLPVSYFVNTKEQLINESPVFGFNTQFGQFIKLKDIKEKTSEQTLDLFLDNLLLSPDAKMFGLARSIAETNHFFKSNLDIFVDLACFTGGYIYCFSRNRIRKLQLAQRRKMYLVTILVGLTISIVSRFFISKLNQKEDDNQACRMGLDCCEGSIEFYTKLINRNKILRQVLDDGSRFIDDDGNYLKQTIYIPGTDYYFHLNYMGEKLTDRRENCKKELYNLIIKLNKKSELEQELIQQEELRVQKEKELDNKEWQIFKTIRTKLESLKSSSN